MAARDEVLAVPVVPLSSGKAMPRVGLGTASFPLGRDGDRRPHVRDAVLHAIDAGYRHFDTAAVYGTERAIGDAAAEALRAGTIASRDELYVSSKLWIADAHPGSVLPALRKTLQNLQMEYVDLYLVHFPVSMKVTEAGGWSMLVKENLVAMDMKGVWEEMEECHRQGLAKAIGVSNFTCKKLEHLLSFAEIIPAVNQVEVHPCCRQDKLRTFCREKGIQLCAYSPLGSKGTPWANHSVTDSPVLKQIAQDMGKSVAQFQEGSSLVHRPALPNIINSGFQTSPALMLRLQFGPPCLPAIGLRHPRPLARNDATRKASIRGNPPPIHPRFAVEDQRPMSILAMRTHQGVDELPLSASPWRVPSPTLIPRSTARQMERRSWIACMLLAGKAALVEKRRGTAEGRRSSNTGGRRRGGDAALVKEEVAT
ncbi:unnamed protein product [Urochloa humidicola]